MMTAKFPPDFSTGRNSDQFPLRLPDGMRDEIATAAKANGRSMNAEIIARIAGDTETLRDKFATLAPDVPDWFMTRSLAHLMREIAAYGAARSVNDDGWAAQAEAWKVGRMARWRWTYADAMLAARKGGA